MVGFLYPNFESMLKKYIKFLPDSFFVAGSAIFTYGMSLPAKEVHVVPSLQNLHLTKLDYSYVNYHVNEKVTGVILIAISITILVRFIVRTSDKK